VSIGLAEKAIKLLREGLSRDPDSEGLASKLRRLKRLVADGARIKEGVASALSARRFEEAAALCADGLRIDAGDRKFAAGLYAERAKAFQLLARSRGRGETRKEREAASAGRGASGAPSAPSAAEPSASGRREADDAVPSEGDDPRAGAKACWRRCLQDASNALYEDESLLGPYLLKAEALQALERWGEAVGVLEAAIHADRSRGHDQAVVSKLAEAQFLVRKAARPDLYAALGVGSKASEKEIRAAYKRLALECHPDRHSDKGEAERKAAEAKFKELGETLDLLTDPVRRQLWDEGHDHESIKQQMQMREQQQQQQQQQRR
jgi:DnaJ family protein C protein 7